jgi:hypothetical protein
MNVPKGPTTATNSQQTAGILLEALLAAVN